MYRLKQKTQIVEINNSEEMELEELDCVGNKVYKNSKKISIVIQMN